MTRATNQNVDEPSIMAVLRPDNGNKVPRTEGPYMICLESLCRRRGWRDPFYETYESSTGYTCIVLVAGREYGTDVVYETDQLARENAAMRAFTTCQNYSVDGGMRTSLFDFNGLLENRRHISSERSSFSLSSLSATSGESESSIESIHSNSSTSTTLTDSRFRIQNLIPSTSPRNTVIALDDTISLALNPTTQIGKESNNSIGSSNEQQVIEQSNLIDMKSESEDIHLFHYRVGQSERTTFKNDNRHQKNATDPRRSGGANQKYSGNPIANEDAPERPPSAYVISVNQIREGTEEQNLTFVESTGLVTENWQTLPVSEREEFEQQAVIVKENHINELTEYKKTIHHKMHGAYLVELKCRQAGQPSMTDINPPIDLYGNGSASDSGSGVTDTCGNEPHNSSNISETNVSESDDSIDSGSRRCLCHRVCSVIGDGERNQDDLAPPILDLMRRKLVDRVMEEFWVIFEQIIRTDNWDGEEPLVDGNQVFNDGSDAVMTSRSSVSCSTQLPIIQHKRQERDEGDDDDTGEQRKRPNLSGAPLSSGVKVVRFACPFRKHNPRKYTMYTHRSCALSCWTTIGRMKEHIYRCHCKSPHCQRCWLTFKSQEQLDLHMIVAAAEICEVKIGQPPEGISSVDERRLRSRKKTRPNQSDEETWKDIYRMLFPSEDVPSPYFEPIQDDAPSSPDARELADYEDYIRRELPSLVRRNIEETVRRETQPLEASLIASLVDIVRDCQERISRDYRQRSGSSNGTQTSTNRPPDISRTTPLPDISQEVTITADYQAPTFLDAITDVTPLHQWAGPDMSELDLQLSDRLIDELSHDSGYGGSLRSCGCWSICSCQDAESADQRLLLEKTTPLIVNTEQDADLLSWSHIPSLDNPDAP